MSSSASVEAGSLDGGPVAGARPLHGVIAITAASACFLTWFAFGADQRALAAIFSTFFAALGVIALILARDQIDFIDLLAPLIFVAAAFHAAAIGGWDRAWPDVAVLGAASGLWVTLCATLSNRMRIERFWTLLLSLALAYSAWAFAEFVIDNRHLFGAERLIHADRLAGSFVSANTAATLFGAFTVLATAHVLRSARRARADAVGAMNLAEELIRRGTLGLALLMFSASCLALTASRAGIAATLVAVSVLLVWTYFAERPREGGRGYSSGVGVGLVVLLAFAAAILLLSGGLAIDRLGDIESGFNDRSRTLSVLVAIWREHFWLGHGFGQLEAARAAAVQPDTLVATIAGAPAAHNIVVQWLVQAGAAGFAAITAVLLIVHARMAAGVGPRRSQRDFVRGVFCVSLLIILHGQLDYALEIPAIVWFWTILLALGVCATRRVPVS